MSDNMLDIKKLRLENSWRQKVYKGKKPKSVWDVLLNPPKTK